MTLTFVKPKSISLKQHPDFNEKWVQNLLCEDPSLLGLGDVELVRAEKIQAKAGRLDVLLYDEQLNRRYEVELMLGATDPSHIVRCIEYWDIERRRYPAYDHVAVLIAEDITSRFLNIMSLLSGSIPLIAIQLVALQVDEKVVLHFVRVLDQTELRADDTVDSHGPGRGAVLTDRSYWEARVSREVVGMCDAVLQWTIDVSGRAREFVYRKRIIDIVSKEDGSGSVWLIPQKALIKVGGYVTDAETWVKRFDDAGILAGLRRGNQAVLASFRPGELNQHEQLVKEFLLKAALGDTTN